jgi:iron complex outermembrane receptor protein
MRANNALTACFTLSRAPVACWCICLLALFNTSFTVQAAPGANETKPVFLEPQPLVLSLQAIATQFNLPFAVNQQHIANIEAPKLEGNFTLAESLTQLLKNTGYSYLIQPHGFTLVQAPETHVNDSAMEEVSVTGIRASLNISGKRKRENRVISDIIASHDIATYPDRNLAESMQRISGISITREAGEGRQIMLRGLNPDFTLVTLNGMPVLANNDSPMDSRQQKQQDRTFDLNLFSSDLFSEIQVLKSYSADQASGGMAGIAALETAHPFDNPGLHWGITQQIGNNQFSDHLSKKLSAMVSSTNDKWGALFSVSYGARESQEMGANTFRWRVIPPDGADTSQLPQKFTEAWNNGEYRVPRGNRYSVWQSDMKRLGVGASLEYKTARHHATFDWLYGRLSGNRFEYHLYPRGYHSTPIIEGETVITAAEVNEKNELVYAAYRQAQVGTESRFQKVSTTYNQWVMNSHHDINSTWKGHLLLGWEGASYDIPTSNKAYMQGVTDVTIDYRQDSRFANITYSHDLTQPTFWRMKELDSEQYFTSTQFINAKYTLSFEPSITRSWQWGVDAVRFENESELLNIQNFLDEEWAAYFNGVPEGTTTSNGVTSVNSAVPAVHSTTLTTHPKLHWLTLDTNNVFRYFNLPTNTQALQHINSVTHELPSHYQSKVTESRVALFTQWQREIGRFHINSGLRVEYENTEVNNISSLVSNVPNIHYTNWLPSLNITYELQPDTLYRLALSRSIGRPQLNDITRPVEYLPETNSLYGFNQNLRPYSSYNLDIAFEKYTSGVNQFSLSAFSKYLDSYIVYTSETVAFSDTLEYANWTGDTINANTLVQRVTTANTERAWLYGLEGSCQLETSWPWRPEYKIGVITNLSYTHGQVQYFSAVTGEKLQYTSLPYLSPWLANVTAYWESYALSARLSATYRDSYLARIGDETIIDEDETGFEKSVYLDAVVAYHLGENWELRAEATNLTNEREEQYTDSAHRAYNTTFSGRNFYLGVTFRH